VAVQRQRRLWLRLIVADFGPIPTISRDAHDGVVNVVVGVAMLNKARAELSSGRFVAGGVSPMRLPIQGHKSRLGAVSLTENVDVA
jgi:hypothetical protein